eukprot:scaffold12829_cov116-Isochrysis_galbana.AAC.20
MCPALACAAACCSASETMTRSRSRSSAMADWIAAELGGQEIRLSCGPKGGARSSVSARAAQGLRVASASPPPARAPERSLPCRNKLSGASGLVGHLRSGDADANRGGLRFDRGRVHVRQREAHCLSGRGCPTQDRDRDANGEVEHIAGV